MKNKYNQNCGISILDSGFSIFDEPVLRPVEGYRASSIWHRASGIKKHSLPCHFAFCILIFALVLPGLAQDTTAAESQDAWAKYQIILQRNIFSRQRGPIRQTQRGEPARTAVTPNPESYFLLKGVVLEGDKFIAFLEDTRGSSVLRLREGDSVARGVVKNVTLDSIDYQWEGRTTSVPLGRDLEGGQGAITMNRLLEMSATSLAAGGQKGASAEPAPSADEAEILKKLMEQRKQQLGQ